VPREFEVRKVRKAKKDDRVPQDYKVLRVGVVVSVWVVQKVLRESLDPLVLRVAEESLIIILPFLFLSSLMINRTPYATFPS
jgi:hypothetical protein